MPARQTQATQNSLAQAIVSGLSSSKGEQGGKDAAQTPSNAPQEAAGAPNAAQGIPQQVTPEELTAIEQGGDPIALIKKLVGGDDDPQVDLILQEMFSQLQGTLQGGPPQAPLNPGPGPITARQQRGLAFGSPGVVNQINEATHPGQQRFDQQQTQFDADVGNFRNAMTGATSLARGRQSDSGQNFAPQTQFFADSQRNLYVVNADRNNPNNQPIITPVGDAPAVPVGGLFPTSNPERAFQGPRGTEIINLNQLPQGGGREPVGAGQPQSDPQAQSGGVATPQAGGPGAGPSRIVPRAPAQPLVEKKGGSLELIDGIGNIREFGKRINAQAMAGERGSTGAFAKEVLRMAGKPGRIVSETFLNDQDLEQLLTLLDATGQAIARSWESGRLSDQDRDFAVAQLPSATSFTTAAGFKTGMAKLAQIERRLIVGMKNMARLKPEAFPDPGELEQILNMPLPSILPPEDAIRDKSDEELMEALNDPKSILSPAEMDRLDALLAE